MSEANRIPEFGEPDYRHGSFDWSKLEELDQLLSDHGNRDRGFWNLEALDGFLTALAIGPRSIDSTEFLPVLWRKSPDWDVATRQHAERLVLRWHDDVTKRIMLDAYAGDAMAEPFVYPLPDIPVRRDADGAPLPETYQEIGKDWAIGFREGMSLDPDGWDDAQRRDRRIPRMLALLSLLETGSDPDDPEYELTNDDALDIVEDLPLMVQDLRDAIALLATLPKPVRREQPKVGRNQPCPCGSSKKYKNCCGREVR